MESCERDLLAKRNQAVDATARQNKLTLGLCLLLSLVILGSATVLALRSIRQKRSEEAESGQRAWLQVKEANDLLEQRVAERTAALQDSEERLALAASATHVGMFDWNVAGGTVLWTQTHEAIFGYAPAATTTTTTTTTKEHDYRKWADRVHPEDMPRVEEEMRRSQQDRKPFDVQYRIIWPDSSLHWVETKGVFLHKSDGKAERMLGVVMEITERKRTEEKLRESEERFRVAQEISPDGFAILRPVRDSEERIVDFTFVYENAAIARLNGTDPAAVVGRRVSEFMPAHSQSPFHEAHARVADTGETCIMEQKYDGGDIPRPIWFRVVVVRTGQDIAIFSQDITERKRMEETVQAAKLEAERHAREMQALLEAVPAAVFIAHDSECRNMSGSRATQELLGLPAHANFSKSAPPNERPANFTALKDGREIPADQLPVQMAAHGQKVTDYEFDIVFNNGTVRSLFGAAVPLLDEAGKPAGAIGAFVDITARKQAESALRQKELELTDAQRIAHVGSWLWIAKTDITTGSDELIRIYGFDPATQTMPNFKDQRGRCYPVEEWERVNAAVQRTMQTGVGYELDVRAICNGKSIWVTTRGELLRDAEGKIVGLHGTVQDITERKRAEDERRESERRFRLALRNAPVSVAAQDRDLRYIWNYNQKTAPAGGLIGKTDAEIFTPEEAAHITAMKRRVLEEGIELREQMWFNRPRGRIFLDVCWEPIRDETGKVIGVGSATVDLTPIKLAEETLAARTEELKTVMDVVPVAIWVSRDPQCQEIFGNATGDRFYEAYQGENVSAGPPTGQPVPPRRFFREGRELTAAELPMQEAAAKGVTVRFAELEVELPSGRRMTMYGGASPLLNADGKVRGSVGAFVDITDRKQAETALRASERLYRAIGESIDYGIWVCDADGRNTYASESFLKLVGITQAQCSDFGWGDLLHPDDIEATIAAWKQCVQRGGPWYREHRFRGADGKWHPILACGVAVRNERNEVTAWAGINLDISQLKRTEETLQASLSEKEVLLKEVHHRVKNNLQVLSSMMNLQADTLDNPVLHVAFDDLRDRVRSMALVHEKLYQSENLARVDFAEYARSLLTYLWRANHDKSTGVRLTLDLQPVEFSVEVAVPCGLLLNELVTNAFKHAFRDRSHAELTVALHTDPDGCIRLRVSDNGIGFPAGLDWRHTRSLGLRLVQMLGRQLGGTVELRQNNGAEFDIIFKNATGETHDQRQNG